MTLEELEELQIGSKVRFHFAWPTPGQQALNGRIAKLHEYDETYERGWKSVSGVGYKYDICVCVRFIDDWRITFAQINELVVVSD